MIQDEPNARTEPLANPFRPRNGVVPPYLAGRDALLIAFDEILAERPLHANWALTGLRGAGKTVLLGEFAARAERAGWVTLLCQLGDRQRDDARLGVGPAIDGGVRQLRPRRITIGEVGYEAASEGSPKGPADRMRIALAGLKEAISDASRPGALLLYDEAHLLADERSRDHFPLSGLLAALAAVQREMPRVRIVLSGLPTLSLNLKRARAYAERMFRHVVVGNLERGDAWDAL